MQRIFGGSPSRGLAAVNEQWDICRFSLTTTFIVGYSLMSVSVDSECNKRTRGQTSRPVFGAEILTSRNTGVVAVVFRFICRHSSCFNVLLELSYHTIIVTQIFLFPIDFRFPFAVLIICWLFLADKVS